MSRVAINLRAFNEFLEFHVLVSGSNLVNLIISNDFDNPHIPDAVLGNFHLSGAAETSPKGFQVVEKDFGKIPPLCP